MKASFTSVFLFFTFLAFAASAPSLRARQADVAENVMSELYTDLQQFMAIINSTTAGLSSNSTDAEKASALTSVTAAISNITAAVEATDAQVQTLSPETKRALAARQSSDDTALENTVVSLITELSGTLDNVVNTLGLSSVLDFTVPLTSELSKLLIDLDKVVDDLLEVVKELLDGILLGLSSALSGLTL